MPGWIERSKVKAPCQFIGPIGAKEGIDHQVGGAFEQIDAAHLRIGGSAMLVAGPTKGQRIGKGVSHVLHRTVDGHQPQPEGKRSRCLVRWHGAGRPARTSDAAAGRLTADDAG